MLYDWTPDRVFHFVCGMLAVGMLWAWHWHWTSPRDEG